MAVYSFIWPVISEVIFIAPLLQALDNRLPNRLHYHLSLWGGVLYASKSDEENLYEDLLAKGYSKQEIDAAIYNCIMHEIACKKAYKEFSFTGKIKWHIKSYYWQATRFCKALTAEGLVLLKTQFAKKPKNPI